MGHLATAMDGGSGAIGREPMRPTAKDGGSAAIDKEPMRPSAKDSGSSNSRETEATEGNSNVIFCTGEIPTAPFAHAGGFQLHRK